jgi:hypothetical protein
MGRMVEAYTSAVDGPPEPFRDKNSSDIPSRVVWPPEGATPRYWVGHDFVTRGLLPLLNVVMMEPRSARLLVDGAEEIVQHILTWKDENFELWDPWPFVALYHHYWPLVILSAWWKGERWSRLNVSTTKMFMA